MDRSIATSTQFHPHLSISFCLTLSTFSLNRVPSHTWLLPRPVRNRCFPRYAFVI